MIADWLRRQGRSYCVREDVERVVENELHDEQSRVRSFVQYLLKQGEEDHASEIEELPALIALAWTLRRSGSMRKLARPEKIANELKLVGVACDPDTLLGYLARAHDNELLIKEGDRYGFATRWLAEWLHVMHADGPHPVIRKAEPDLVLNRYRIVELVASGGQGTVYRARDTRVETRVILKVYPRTQINGVSGIVEREAKALSQIEHDGVVRCLDFGIDQNKGDVIVLELVPGMTLRSLLSEQPKSAAELIGVGGKLSTQVKLLVQLASALTECHRAGVVHKDLKPENVVIGQRAGLWLPKIIDFGLAAQVGAQTANVSTVGSYTPGYVAPERYNGECRRAPSDVYSLGVIAHEVLTGVAPFPMDPAAAREAQVKGRFQSLKELRPDVPLRLSELISSMLASDPAARPNAITVMNELPLTLDSTDWKELFTRGKDAYGNADAETALSYFERAAFSARDADRGTREYAELLGLLLDSSEDCDKTLVIAPKLAQVYAVAILAGAQRNIHDAGKALEGFIEKLMQKPANDSEAKESKRSALSSVLITLSDHAPVMAGKRVVEALVAGAFEPPLTQQREDIFLLASAYREANLVDTAMLLSWCLTWSKRLRERGEPLASCQVWLQRAERLSGAGSQELRQEQARVEALLRKTATPSRLARRVADQEPVSKVVGDNERGHLHVERIQHWAGRLLKLHPYVQAIRRVRKDPGVPLYPTRVLDSSNLAQHVAAAKGIPEERLIPAVLDASYCNPSTTALRINIILGDGTTIAERELATEELRKDSSLFGDDA